MKQSINFKKLFIGAAVVGAITVNTLEIRNLNKELAESNKQCTQMVDMVFDTAVTRDEELRDELELRLGTVERSISIVEFLLGVQKEEETVPPAQTEEEEETSNESNL